MVIQEQKIPIKINTHNIKYYNKIGFECNLNDVIGVNIEDLHSDRIKFKVRVKCDKCGKEEDINLLSHSICVKLRGSYICKKCAQVKTIDNNMMKYGKKYFTNPEKAKKTNLEKYGCENVSQSKQIKEKKKETNLKNWGTENVFQSEKIKEISKKTKKEKYDDEYFTNRDKSKKTCLINNGVEWPTQSKEVLEMRNLNNKTKWGVEHYQLTEEYRNRVNESNVENYGAKWYMSSKDFKDKSKITNLEKYGVEHNMQNENIYIKSQINGQKASNHDKMGLFYRGSYEKDFLDYCFENKIKIEKGIRFSYVFDEKNSYYFSDYFIPSKNLIIEIKSDYYYRKYYKRNILKMNSAILNGYNFIFIIDKNYDEFERLYMK